MDARTFHRIAALAKLLNEIGWQMCMAARRWHYYVWLPLCVLWIFDVVNVWTPYAAVLVSFTALMASWTLQWLTALLLRRMKAVVDELQK
jgi:hypothetical protein